MLKILVLLASGLGGLLFMFLHAVGPAVVLMGIAPFDAMFFLLFGPILGNAITYIPILIFAARTSPALWTRIFFASRIQLVAALFLVYLVIPHIIPVVELGSHMLISYARKITYVLLLSVFAWSMREPRHVATIVKVFVACSAIWIFLSLVDFYLGIQVLPVKAGGWGEEGAFGVEFESYLAGALRFSGAGLPVNRTGQYLGLPILLGVGWFSLVKNPLEKAISLGCVIVLIVSLIATVGRAPILGTTVGGLILMMTAFRMRFQQVVAVAAIGGVLAAVSWYGIEELGPGTLEARFQTDQVAESLRGRFDRVLVGFSVWSESPVIGVGDALFSLHSRKILAAWGDTGGTDAHNSYMKTLAETGIIGFAFFITIVLMALRRLGTSIRRDSAGLDFWRPYFLAGFVAQLVGIWFHTYHWERIFWFNIAFAASLEQVATAAQVRRFREASQGDAARPGLGVGELPLGTS